MEHAVSRKSTFTTRKMVQIAILSAIAYGLMFLQMPIAGLFPGFLKIDLSDIPGILGGLAFGPVSGLLIIVVKNFLQLLTATTTGGVGEVANTVIGGAYVLVTCLIYQRSKNTRGLVIGFIMGTLVMIIVGTLMNYFINIPFYGKIMGLDAILGMGKAINPRVNSVFDFCIWFIAPFNLIKGIIVSGAAFPIYKKLAKLLHS